VHEGRRRRRRNACEAYSKQNRTEGGGLGEERERAKRVYAYRMIPNKKDGS
jgi:hypothetical protein